MKDKLNLSKFSSIIKDFHQSYIDACAKSGLSLDNGNQLFYRLIELVQHQVEHPTKFSLFHQSVRKPIDYYQFGLDFISPLIDFENSKILHFDRIERINDQLARGENVIFLANHQTEPDPQIINLLLKKHGVPFSSQMIFVAGHRVVEDPIAIPMSLGCNLLCIYSKKHIDHPPEDKPKKVSHNQRTMKKMSELLSEGGKCIYVAPSGGRDRVNAQGLVEVSPFDPQSIELFLLISQRAAKPTHFYPLTLLTYDLLPPPSHVEKELGERRIAHHTPVYLSFGEEIDMDHFPGSTSSNDKKEKRNKRADYIWNIVLQDFHKLIKMRSKD
ncbi:MAG: 1-acyl-sn-glycerol-3-phosphate acyltransferase [Parachlamydiaceae bacterium]|nr:1-acyl-sn-glycerol-3-phosphate acyltransferase [Parachlamydiaceae bacterium]